jgi:glucose/arabinose dehydrogenase
MNLPIALLLGLFAFQDQPAGPTAARGQTGENVPEGFVVRPGYKVTLAAGDLEEARFIEFGENGVLYVSMPQNGKIQTLKDADGDGVYESRVDFVTDQSNCHSMDFANGWLYYTSSQQGYCRRARDTDGDGKADDVEDVITEGIPTGGGHPFRGVLVAPDYIYITVSDPQNMTRELESDRKTLYRFAYSGNGKAGEREVFATGIRNTEKLQYRIGKDGSPTQEIWGSDHGSDMFGVPYGDRPARRAGEGSQPITDLNPPDELNKFVEGGFYGHPYLMADRTPRPEFADREDLHELAEKTIPAAWPFGAHTAVNGFTFLSGKAGEALGAGHTGDLFQAQHGSWNSSVPVGYAVTRVFFDPMTGMPFGEWAIVTTHDGRRPLARPVDCAEAPDGTILWSCDQTRRIYRIAKAET